MTPCQHASYCPRRMRDGDRFNGCTSVTEKHCAPPLGQPAPVLRHDRIAERYLFATIFSPPEKV